MKKRTKKIIITVSSILAALILLVAAYVIYVIASWYRLPDDMALEIENPQEKMISADDELTIATYNMGFGAYGPEFSFFMDSGVMDDGTPVSGKYGKSISKEYTERNTKGAVATIREIDADFCFLQEVDVDSTRAHHVNQYEAIKEGMKDRSSVFALNFDTPYSIYPLSDPHGKTLAGIVTLSRYRADSVTRRSYPIADDFSKYFELDRCFSIMRLPVDNGKELVLINSHMSAYDEGGKIRKKQLDLLKSVMSEEYEKGNYVIVGGDFNHILGDHEADMFPSRQRIPGWLSFITSSEMPEGFMIATAENAETNPTCRAAEIPWEKGVNYTCIIDGFIVSDNISWRTENLSTDFAWSDHEPVLMTFTLDK